MATIGYLDTDALEDNYMALIRKTGQTPTASIPVLVPIASSKAYHKIVEELAARGYNPTQIAAWDQGADYQTSLAFYWLLSSGSAMEAPNMDQKSIDSFDLRADLKTLIVTNSGLVVDPTLLPGQPASVTEDQANEFFGKFWWGDYRFADPVTRF
jgi:hypothetical protein